MTDDLQAEILLMVKLGWYTKARDLLDRLIKSHEAAGSEWPVDVLIELRRRRGGEVQEPITFRRGKE